MQDLGPVVDAGQLDGCPGIVYGDSKLHIETYRPEWTGTPAAAFQFLLVIGNQEWVSNDLTELEQRLYEYGIDEGIL